MTTQRVARLFKNGSNQALRIPREFELPGNEVLIHKEGDRLIVEPAPKKSLVELLASLEPIDDEFPEIEELPIEDVEL
jgi:antitoxin VapB